jgi:heme/copper-type cytochrome/quinol oxidase subunit 3
LDNFDFKENLERRETLGSTALDAEPQMRVWLANDSIFPFLTAVALTAQFISQMFSLNWVIVFTVITLALLAAWFWPRGRELSTEWVKSGPAGALPASPVVEGKGVYPPMFYGSILISLTEAAELAFTVVVYYFLRAGTNDWPPGDMPRPELLIPTLGTIILILSLVPGYLDDKEIKANNMRKVTIYTAIETAMEAVFIGVLWYHLSTLNFKWDDNAYASVYWISIILSLIFTAGTVFEGIYIIVQLLRGQYNAERHWAIEVDGLTNFVGVGQWVLIYFVIFISPYLMR